MMRRITTAWVIMFIALTCQALFDPGLHRLRIYPYLTLEHKYLCANYFAKCATNLFQCLNTIAGGIKMTEVGGT